MPGIWELLIILAIVMLIFGAKRLPALGEALGKTISGFRKSADESDALKGDTADAKELTSR